MSEISKDHILEEIKRLAGENNGKPLGRNRFEQETGITRQQWGKYWARFGDAIVSAGFQPNKMSALVEDKILVGKYIELIREYKKFPTEGEIRVKCHEDSSYPSIGTMRRFGRKAEVARKIIESDLSQGLDDVINICKKVLEQEKNTKPKYKEGSSAQGLQIGEVYLIKHGKHNEYKIGKSNDTVRRAKELGTQMPQRLDLIHSILTDDPSGVEAYWHRRFKDKNTNGEWFSLSADDIKAFKRWKKIV